MKSVKIFQTSAGKQPFTEWLDSLEPQAQARVYAYIDRVALGAKKNIEAVGNGVFEIKMNFGPGYRVYFAEIGTEIILLLAGGDKGSQSKDIRKAKEFWGNYETH